jgi:proteasome lid subunit RPN8/RPN11
MWHVKNSVIEDLIESSKKVYPKEFLCFLGGDRESEEITEIVFLPTISGETSASINVLSMPFDDTIIGSFHSHPHGSAFPSTADKKFFHKYPINIILSLGFKTTVCAFNNDGNEITLDIIDN